MIPLLNLKRHKLFAILAFSFLLLYGVLGGILGYISSQILGFTPPLSLVLVLLGVGLGLALGHFMNSFFIKSYIA